MKRQQLTKGAIRSRILLKLKTQEEEERVKKSRSIKDKLLKTYSFKKARVIMFYIAFGGEVDTKEMIEEALKKGKIAVVPVCRKKRIRLRPCLLNKHSRLKKGLYGICEPAVKKFIHPGQVDLVIVPGVAFDKKGRRLGRGKGCYDRFLNTLSENTTSIGLAFDFQILPSVPAAEHDVSVDKLVFA